MPQSITTPKTQPLTKFAINWSLPITRELVFAVVYSDARLINIATGSLPTISSSIVRNNGLWGRTAYAASGEFCADWTGVVTTSDRNGAGDFTLLSYSAPVPENNKSSLLSQCAGGGSEQCYLLANTGTGYNAVSGVITFGQAAGGSTAMLASPSGVITGAATVFVGVRRGGDRYLDINGVQVSTASGTQVDVFLAGTTIRSSGILGYTGWTRPHPHLVQLAWNRALSPYERAEIGRNPWHVFAPSRFWIPSQTAAAVAPTLTAAVAHNLGSTTVTPRVTFTR